MKSYFFGVFAACENASFCLCFEDFETGKIVFLIGETMIFGVVVGGGVEINNYV